MMRQSSEALFERDSVKRWRRAVHKELRWLKLPSEDSVYRAAMVCAGIFCFGTDVAVLAEVSGQEPRIVRSVLKQLRRNRALTGRTLRANGGWDGKHGALGMMLDAMVAAGDLYRPPDEKRSAAAKARKMSTERKARKPHQRVEPGTVFRPKVSKSDPLYGLAEWGR